MGIWLHMMDNMEESWLKKRGNEKKNGRGTEDGKWIPKGTEVNVMCENVKRAQGLAGYRSAKASRKTDGHFSLLMEAFHPLRHTDKEPGPRLDGLQADISVPALTACQGKYLRPLCCSLSPSPHYSSLCRLSPKHCNTGGSISTMTRLCHCYIPLRLK